MSDSADPPPRSASGGDDSASRSTGDDDTRTGDPRDVSQQADWRGWLLVGVVVLSVLVFPLFVLYIPEASWLIGRLGFSQRQAYIVFPMLPALLLGLTAVWVAVRTRS